MSTSSALFLSAAAAAWTMLFILGAAGLLTRRRARVIQRLQSMRSPSAKDEEDDILNRPLWDRTLGALIRSMVGALGQVTPKKVLSRMDERLLLAGNPRNQKAQGLLAAMSMLGLFAFSAGFLCFWLSGSSWMRALAMALPLSGLAVYIPWFRLGRVADRRQKDVRRSLPEVMDLMVVSVEAGLGFDMALLRVVEKYKGTVSDEFQRVLKEIQIGKSRKDAMKDMTERVDVSELTALVSAIVQSEQLGVGIAKILRMQSDMIREKRQQAIEEQAMKAPVKMLFPMVFFIFPSIFVVLLGPAILNIMKALSGF